MAVDSDVSATDDTFISLFDDATADSCDEFIGFQNQDETFSSSDASSDDDSNEQQFHKKIVRKQRKQIDKKRQMLNALMRELDEDPTFVKMKTASLQKSQCRERRWSSNRQSSTVQRLYDPPVTRQRGSKKLFKPLHSSLRVKLFKKPVKRICRPPLAHKQQPRTIIKVEDVTRAMLGNVAKHSVGKQYDTVNGTTCHQCRQKTTDTKSCCRSEHCVGVRGMFCGPCLKNRYGEVVEEVLLNPEWQCPVCRGVCNCSICRNRNGKCATGILINLARHHGFTNVKAYLDSFSSEQECTDI